MKKNLAQDFYEIQRLQWQKSLFLFLVLLLFYIVAVAFVALIGVLSFGIFISSQALLSGSSLKTIILTTVIISLAIAVFHFYDARKFGAEFIRKRLQAKPPEPNDRYHKKFTNTVEEIRIASGLPKVNPYILPAFAINSMALIESDNSPSVIVTEGPLAEFTRNELQAVIAHELAHVSRGDTFYITLVCSLANFFERIRDATEPDDQAQAQPGQAQEVGGHILVYLAATLSGLIMHLLSTLISRQREILADAAAVEFSRNPKALACAIYKAHVKNSFVGDFNLTYSPLFIVPPESKGGDGGGIHRIFNSHPPLMRRIRLLADMIPVPPAKIIEEVWETQKNRKKARRVIQSPDEMGGIPDRSISQEERISLQEGRLWSVRNPKGKWEGPLSLEELLSLRFFTPKIWVKNLQEEVEASAFEFPQIRTGIRNVYHKKPINMKRHNRCPRCRIQLRDDDYEGVCLKICPECHGKLIDAALIDRIVARKEIAFSEHLLDKARRFKQHFMEDPARTQKINAAKSPDIFCPNCSTRMLSRPYNYHYIVPVDKCLSCYQTWFDTDELEILQILIETY